MAMKRISYVNHNLLYVVILCIFISAVFLQWKKRLEFKKFTEFISDNSYFLSKYNRDLILSNGEEESKCHESLGINDHIPGGHKSLEINEHIPDSVRL
jgi:hypothetical protein